MDMVEKTRTKTARKMAEEAGFGDFISRDKDDRTIDYLFEKGIVSFDTYRNEWHSDSSE